MKLCLIVKLYLVVKLCLIVKLYLVVKSYPVMKPFLKTPRLYNPTQYINVPALDGTVVHLNTNPTTHLHRMSSEQNGGELGSPGSLDFLDNLDDAGLDDEIFGFQQHSPGAGDAAELLGQYTDADADAGSSSFAGAEAGSSSYADAGAGQSAGAQAAPYVAPPAAVAPSITSAVRGGPIDLDTVDERTKRRLLKNRETARQSKARKAAAMEDMQQKISELEAELKKARKVSSKTKYVQENTRLEKELEETKNSLESSRRKRTKLVEKNKADKQSLAESQTALESLERKLRDAEQALQLTKESEETMRVELDQVRAERDQVRTLLFQSTEGYVAALAELAKLRPPAAEQASGDA